MKVAADLGRKFPFDAMWCALSAARPGVEDESNIGRVGNLAQWLDYGPYGIVLASENTGTTTAARQYIGQFSDASGLSYLNARYYNPTQGQFLSQDPIFLSLGNQNQLQQLSQQDRQTLLQNPQQLNSSTAIAMRKIIRRPVKTRQVNTEKFLEQ
jgi:RHS repeat-associated protein